MVKLLFKSQSSKKKETNLKKEGEKTI